MINGFKSTEDMYNAYWRDYFNVDATAFPNHLESDWILSSGLTFDTALEIGCGNGGLVEKLRQAGKTAYGLEYSTWLFDKHLKKRNDPLKYFHGDASDIDFPDNAFDLVCSFDVLEHLPEDLAIKAVNEIYRVTKKYFYGTISDRLDFHKKFHLTVKPHSWWNDYFIDAGFSPIEVPAKASKIFAYEKRG